MLLVLCAFASELRLGPLLPSPVGSEMVGRGDGADKSGRSITATASPLCLFALPSVRSIG